MHRVWDLGFRVEDPLHLHLLWYVSVLERGRESERQGQRERGESERERGGRGSSVASHIRRGQWRHQPSLQEQLREAKPCAYFVAHTPIFCVLVPRAYTVDPRP